MKFRIRELRESKRMSQEELSLKSGVNRTTISALENNAIDSTTTRTLLAIADALEVAIEELFFTDNV